MTRRHRTERAFGWPEGTIRALITIFLGVSTIIIGVIGVIYKIAETEGFQYVFGAVNSAFMFMLGYYVAKK